MSSQNTANSAKPVETSPLLTNASRPDVIALKNQQPQPPTVNIEVKPTNITMNTANTASADHPLAKPDTDLSWAPPAGLPLRDDGDECLLIFRRAVGINNDIATTFAADNSSLEKGRKHASGIYRHILKQKKKKFILHHTLGIILYACHLVQIIVAAILTALGPKAKRYEIAITVLAAVNTIIAGILALLKGSGVIERLAKDEVEFRKLLDWIEETESLVSAGIIGISRKDVGKLVETTFYKYNACFGSSSEIMSRSDVENSQAFSKSAAKPF